MIRVHAATLRCRPLAMRMPFRYGIVTVHGMVHGVVRVEAEIDGRRAVGYAADNLAPKWFVKNPATSIDDDVAQMQRAIEAACAIACEAGAAANAFDFWMHVHAAMRDARDADGERRAPLLASFAASLIERAVIDAQCRASGAVFHEALRGGLLGFDPAAVHGELAGGDWRALLPARPLREVHVRHTVGWLDALTGAEDAAELPQDLAANVRRYGLTHFKIKVSGDAARDRERLRAVAAVLDADCAAYVCSLDGNEQFPTIESFRAWWEEILSEPALRRMRDTLLFVEQPLARAVSLTEETGAALRAWPSRPRIIIDEADGDLLDARAALDLGYAGASHKNCKGVFRGAANACLFAVRGGLQTGEDLTNVGPIALQQDLAVMATLGIANVERNGHHYFRGLSMFPRAVNDAVLAAHGDAYEHMTRDCAALRVRGGALHVGSMVDAPFGYGDGVNPEHIFETAMETTE